MKNLNRLSNTLVFIAGLLIGASLIFTGLIATPTVCRQVVLKDLKESAAYTQALNGVLPDPQGSDFVAALTRGRK